jgi:Carboxypeptidase regulatory-like domain
LKKLSCTSIWILLLAGLAFGQLASNTSLVGNVTDPSGALVGGANMVAVNQGTQETYTTTTNAEGFYEFQFVKAGTYTITAQQSGFETLAKTGVAVSANQTVRTDFVLKVGEVSEKVEVTADIAPIKTDEAVMNELISTKTTAELPLNGRDAMRLAITTPGVLNGFKTTGNPGGGQGFIGAGTREIQNSISLDGVSIMTNLITQTTLRPSVDAIQEVQVQTGTYPAQYGGYLGVQINMVTKSGTNDFHGSVFEFLRNDKLDAKNFFTRAGANKAPFRQNQFGVNASGPVWIPKVYDGKNKTFFMFGWESLRLSSAAPGIDSVLTPKMRQGDLSELTTVSIVDPLAPGKPAFPGNIIPTNRISQQALRILQYMPQANGSGVLNNFNTNVPNNNDTDQYTFRIDQSVGEQNRLFFRYSYSDTALLNGNTNPYNGYNQPVGDRNFVFGYTRVLSSSAVNDFRFGRHRSTIDSLNFFTNGGFPADAGSQLGIPGFTTDEANPGLPVIAIANYMPIGGQNMASTNWFQNDTTWQISDIFSFTKGAHNLAAGFDSRKVITNRTANNAPRGQFSFSGQLSNHPVADFLLGLPNQVVSPGPLFPGGGEQWRYSWFLQDKWQVNSKLTLNYGLRYELPIVPQSTTGNGTILNPEQTAFIPAQVPSKIPYHSGDHNNFAPRFGFAYRFTNDLVLRGGFGVYYNPNQMNTFTLATTNPPFSTIFTYNTVQAAPNLSFDNPTGASGPAAAPKPNAFTINPYLPNATMNQWSMSLERGLWSTAGIALEYLGSHSYHLDRSFFNNTPAPGPGIIDDRRPNQLFRSIRTIQNDLIANYEAMSIVFRQQGFKGLTLLSSYTWSHTTDVSTDSNGGSNVMNPYNWRLDYGSANWDVRHRFVSSFTYELPFFANTTQRVVKNVLGGWQLNGISTLQSGFPFSVTISADRANVGQGTQRANILSPTTANCGGDPRVSCIPISSFGLPDQFTYGNTGRNIFNGPGLVDFDLSLFKTIVLTERARLQFRTEFFNSFNHPSFSNPNSTFVPGSTNFGTITSTSTNNRQIQFGLKILF